MLQQISHVLKKKMPERNQTETIEVVRNCHKKLHNYLIKISQNIYLISYDHNDYVNKIGNRQ